MLPLTGMVCKAFLYSSSSHKKLKREMFGFWVKGSTCRSSGLSTQIMPLFRFCLVRIPYYSVGPQVRSIPNFFIIDYPS